MKQFLAAIIIIVSGLCVKPASALWNCSDAELLSHSFGYTQNSYTISWRCSEVYSNGVKIEVKTTAYGGWKKNTKVASETIKSSYRRWDENGSPTGEWENSENLSASCQKDPWLFELPCLPTGSSRTILAKTVRAYLKQQYASQRTAPEILEPHDGGTFDYPADLTVKVRHHPDHNVRFKIEWRADATQAWKSVTNSIIYGKQTSNGVTTAKMRPMKIGKWALRVQLDTSADPWWSDPCTFTVNEGAPKLKFLSPKPVQVFYENSTITFQLHMESGTPWNVGDAEGGRPVLIEIWRKPLPKEGGIEPLLIKIGERHVPTDWFESSPLTNSSEGVYKVVAKYPSGLSEGEKPLATAEVNFKIIKPLLGEPPEPPNKPLALKLPLVSQKIATVPLAQQNLKPQTTNLPVTAQHGALKTAPSIIGPAENQRFGKTGTIPINAKVSAADVSLIWEIEYQAFGATSFLRQKPSLAGGPATGAGMVKTARLTFSAPGTYRFRAKEDGDQARWSPWRTIVVGSKPVPIPAVKTAPLQEKPALSRDAVKPETTQKKISPTETPANKMPSPATNQLEQVKPATINQQKKPTLKPFN